MPRPTKTHAKRRFFFRRWSPGRLPVCSNSQKFLADKTPFLFDQRSTVPVQQVPVLRGPHQDQAKIGDLDASRKRTK